MIPNGTPAAGTLSELANTGNLYYNDYAWSGLPQGWYAYGVKAMYTSGLYSGYTISNIAGHLMDYRVTVNVTLSTGLEPVNVEVELKGSDFPYETFLVSTPASGIAVFDHVWKGHYDISAFKIGYETYTIENSYITADKVFNIILSEKKYPPTNLKVDPVSLEATWDSAIKNCTGRGISKIRSSRLLVGKVLLKARVTAGSAAMMQAVPALSSHHGTVTMLLSITIQRAQRIMVAVTT